MKETESIMISKYPEMDSTILYEEEALKMEKILLDIKEIRNLKATNKVTKENPVSLEAEDEFLPIYKSQLKIIDTVDEIKDPSYQKVTYESSFIKITYYIKDSVDRSALEEEIGKLEKSIKRREELLSNKNYVEKAPKNIVDLDRKKLKEEQERLESIKKQL